MKYLLTVLSSSALLVGAAATLNWTMDPAGIFHQTAYGQQYAKALIESKYGLIFPDSLDEREFKVELAKYAAQYDCLVVGSSHMMQIGSARRQRSFSGCKNILNLGVSGAGIEDHITLSWLSLSNGKPRKLILGVDPWTFAFNKDERWKVRYADHYQVAWAAIGQSKTQATVSSNRWSSLVSAQYTKRSVGRLLRGAQPIKVAQNVDEELGSKDPITLPDGSHVYSAEHIATAKSTKVPVGGSVYKTEGTINDARAIRAYYSLVRWIQSQGVQPVLLMTPYHQNVWALEASLNVRAMVATETIVREMGEELAVQVVGSFRPDLVGCSPSEFYDFMHPMASCVARLSSEATK